MLAAVLWFLAILVVMAVPPKTYNRYLLPAYPAVALLAGWGLCNLLSERARARVPAVATAFVLTVACLVATIPVRLHTNPCKGFVEAGPLLNRLSPGATIAAYKPDEPPGPSRQPQQWVLRSCAVYYLGRNYVNYQRPQDAAAAGERFVISGQADSEALRAAGYEPFLLLGYKYWLFDRGPGPFAAVRTRPS